MARATGVRIGALRVQQVAVQDEPAHRSEEGHNDQRAHQGAEAGARADDGNKYGDGSQQRDDRDDRENNGEEFVAGARGAHRGTHTGSLSKIRTSRVPLRVIRAHRGRRDVWSRW